MYREAIDQVLAIWSGEAPYNIKGDYWTISTERTLIPELGQGMIAKPYQRPHPPSWSQRCRRIRKASPTPPREAGAQSPAISFCRCGVKSHWPKFVEGCVKGGRAVDPANWRVAKSIFVADDYETAKRYATGTDGPYHSYFKSITTKMIRNGRAGLFKRDRNARIRR